VSLIIFIAKPLEDAGVCKCFGYRYIINIAVSMNRSVNINAFQTRPILSDTTCSNKGFLLLK